MIFSNEKYHIKMIKKSNKMVVIFLCIILTIQVCFITHQFVTEKEGHHADEVASYNFANGWFSGYLYSDMDGNTINMGTWESGQVLRNALEVQSGQQFRYDSVLYNQKKDLSPPLHSLILHTICSFFPDTFSWYYAFGINIFALIITGIFMCLIGKELFDSLWQGLFLAMYYGFTTAALNSTLYLRMYGLLAMFATILVYLHIRVYRKKSEKIKMEFIFIALITILGGMTHYYFLILAFFLTVFWDIWLCVRKQWKVFLIYSGMMAISAALVIMAFPVILSYLNTGNSVSSGSAQMLYSWEIIQSLNYILTNITGLSLPGIRVLLAILVSIIICVIAFGLPICFLFRRTDRFQNIKSTVITFFKTFPKSLVIIASKINWSVIFLIFTSIFSVSIIAWASNIYAMGSYASRYFFYLMPIGAILIYYFIKKILGYIFRKQWIKNSILFCLLILCIFNSHRLCGGEYLFKYNSSTGIDVTQLTENANCIYAASPEGILSNISVEILNCKQFFELPATYIEIGKEPLEELKDTESPIYLLVEQSAFFSMKDTFGSEYTDANGNTITYEDVMTKQEFLKEISTLSFVKEETYIDSIYTFKGWIDIYRLN